MKKMIWTIVAVAVLALILSTGCATVGKKGTAVAPAPKAKSEAATLVPAAEAKPSPLEGKLAELKKDLADLKTKVESKAEAKDLTDLKAKVESKAEAKDLADLKQKLTQVQAEAGKISDLEKKLTEAAKDVGSLKKEVANIKIRVVRINEAVGIALELSETEGERYFPVGPFYSGKAELEPRGKKVLSTLLALMKKEGLIAKKVWAFADPRRAKAAKDEGEGRKMNLELSKKRGEALTKELGELGKDAEIFGKGETDKFGDLPENRMALVVLISAPATPPPTPPPAGAKKD